MGCVFGACCCHGSLSSVHGSLMSCVIDRNLRSQARQATEARQARQATRPRGQKKRSVLRFWERRFLWETAAVYVEVLFNSMIVEIKRWLVLKWVKTQIDYLSLKDSRILPLQANFQKLVQFNPGTPCDPEKDQTYLGTTMYKNI